ncbi:MAG: AMP-binding protein [Simplicispira sp.]|nr:AMP-binding protein [Simplicispira sp.]
MFNKEAYGTALVHSGFHLENGKWAIAAPEFANIAEDTVGRCARTERRDHPALIFEDGGGSVKEFSFAHLNELANRLASSLRAMGVRKGEPVGVHLDQRPETAIAHLALYKLGAIVCTMSSMYGHDTLAHVMRDAQLRFIFTRNPLGPLRAAIADLEAEGLAAPRIIDCNGQLEGLLADGDPRFIPVETRAEDPALLMYTSGSTGLPKGMLHAHRVLFAYLPTVRMFYDLSLDDADAVFWTPADWAWVGGLLDLVLPAWAHGRTVLAWAGRFDALESLRLMARHGVTHSFMTPTALKRLAEIDDPRQIEGLRLKAVCTGGESLPGEVLEWTDRALGAVCNEFYGLTEVNHLIGNCRAAYPNLPGSMGKVYPGHNVRFVDEAGEDVAVGEVGEIVVRADDPTLFLGYWGRLGIPEEMRLGNWLRTRDLARIDQEGYVWYQGRNDDLIKSAGYRIGPAEVEDALLRHPTVAEAAVVGSPDPQRGMVVKAFVRLRAGAMPSDALVEELQRMVKTDLALYKYPREIEFVESFPLTSSGKIRRAELRRLEVLRKQPGMAV